MKALVTGASGFIGLNLVERLIKDGWQVKALVRSRNKSKLFPKEVEIVIADLVNLKTVTKTIQNVDIVFNLAGALLYHKLPETAYFDANVTGVKNLLEIYKNLDIKRFVHVSTVGIYGSTKRKIINEKSPLVLQDIYSQTKAAGEKLAFDYYQKYKIPVTVIKPTIAYGPHDKRPGFINLFQLIQKRLFLIVGNGKNNFHTIYVENLIDALLLAATKKKAVGEDFIIGDNICPTMNDLVKEITKAEKAAILPFHIPYLLGYLIGKIFDIFQMIGLPSLLNSQRFKFITDNRKYSIEKAKNILGYKPRYNLEQGINKTYLWYKEHDLLR